MASFKYKMWPVGRRVVICVLAVMAASGVAYAVVLLKAGQPSRFDIVWMVLFFVGMVGNCYWQLFRFSLEIELDGDVLIATRAFDSRKIDVDHLTAIRPMRFAPTVAVFEVSDAEPVLVGVRKGFTEFVAAISQQNPALPIEISRFAKNAEFRPGKSV